MPQPEREPGSPSAGPGGWYYGGNIVHHRLRPKDYRFNYRLFLLEFDLDRLDELAARTSWLSHNRFNLFSFHDRDYLRGEDGPLKPRLLTELGALGWNLPADARVRLLTFPRMLGYVFHPVSFYYLDDATGRPLGAAVEVGNTFGEKKLFALPDPGEDRRHRSRQRKDFYVSPFSPLDLEFDFRLGRPAERLAIDIHEHDADGPVLLTHLRAQRRELNGRTLLRAFFAHPLLTVRVIAAIHRHALVLWLLRLPVTPKRSTGEGQLRVMRRHPNTLPATES